MTKGKQWVAQDLPIDDVRVHQGLQFRVGGLNQANLNRIRKPLQHGEDARDPIDVARVGKALYVVDGFHRLEAYRAERRPTIPARVAKMSLEEATEHAKTSNAANGKPYSRADKLALWQAYVDAGWHLADEGTPLASRVIAKELGDIFSHETIRKKLKAIGLELDVDVEFDGTYKPQGPSEEELEQELLEEAEDAVGALGGALVTLEPTDRERLVAHARRILDAVELEDERERVEALKALRAPLLDI